MIEHKWNSAKWHYEGGSGTFQSARSGSGGNRWEHYEALADAIETGGEVTPNERDGREYLRIFDAANESCRTGETVMLQ